MTSALEVCKTLGSLAWETYGPFIPMSKAKKEEFLYLVDLCEA